MCGKLNNGIRLLTHSESKLVEHTAVSSIGEQEHIFTNIKVKRIIIIIAATLQHFSSHLPLQPFCQTARTS